MNKIKSNKPTTITVKNYRQFKPSEFIRSFVTDLEMGINKSKRTGKAIRMATFTKTRECLPCLGGLACMNFGERSGFSFKSNSLVLHYTAFLGNNIRLGNINGITDVLIDLYPDYKYVGLGELETFSGEYYYNNLQPLIDQIHKVADTIERSGQ